MQHYPHFRDAQKQMCPQLPKRHPGQTRIQTLVVKYLLGKKIIKKNLNTFIRLEASCLQSISKSEGDTS